MRRKTLIARFCDADKRRANEALCNLAELTPVDTLSALAEVEYQNDWAEGVK